MAGLLGFTLADLSGAVDSRKRQYANLVRGLLSDPGATLAQLAAVDAEAARGNRYTQMSAGSVMPEVAQQGQEAMLNAAMNVGGLLGITAYHGSPHTFDKFDMSKIGTGEGAQAYGHGLYFAESPTVAKEYQKQLTERGGPEGAAAYMLRMYKDGALENAEAQAAMPHLTPEAKKFAEAVRDHLRAGNINKGNLYKVDIPDEAVSKMLDWDKPLSQQPEAVQSAFRKAREVAGMSNEYWKPSSVVGAQHEYGKIAQRLGPDKASALLKDLGIPGIRYLDAGSRGKGGTSNFVLFDDNLPKILSRE